MLMKNLILVIGSVLILVDVGWAAPISDVTNTKHNLSVSAPADANVRAVSETEVCVFCHTPHGATKAPGAPLWNRELSNQTYTVYTSSSLDANTIQQQLDQPGGSSKLCLSCHDGTLALGTVNVRGGKTNVLIPLTGTAADGTMPHGRGQLTGFTRDLGIDLTNDHPISVTYNTDLVNADGELRDPANVPHIDIRRPGVRPPVPLEAAAGSADGQIQCVSCHDPHIRDEVLNKNTKFLRLNRFQEVNPGGGAFDQAGDIVCIACHDKNGWAGSAHAQSVVANETYTSQAANDREFPVDLPVWQAACLNCHDTHTVQGARRLAREGTDSTSTPKSGGGSAIEETCYQCHSSNPVVTNASGEIKDIKSDFQLARRMPITTADQQVAPEVHDIIDKDFLENVSTLGKGNPANRHVECTDCHNPHRVMKNRLFNGSGANSAATHDHATGHTNLASGALRGAWGVEPLYGGSAFLGLPTTYLVKKGDGGTGASTDINSTHVTREYQICLKCHSDFAYDDTGVYPEGGRPNPGDSGGGTPSSTNGLTQFTNQAMELQAPLFHKGETTASDSGAGSGYTLNNHRSWHPVISDTGRSLSTRGGMASGAFVTPWTGGNVGSQTMYCSDCHGTNTAANTVVPSGNGAWGPHGSTNNFLLKGTWSTSTGNNSDRTGSATDPNNGLCFKCHDWRTYVDRDSNGNRSGFSCIEGLEPSGCSDRGPFNNGHGIHADRIGSIRCMWCHVAVPHGWKNKGLLVNLNDVGPEAGGFVSGTEVPINSSGQVFSQGPYYQNGKLKVITFAPSGQWQPSNCGSASNNPSQGRDWMKDVCQNPP